MLMNTVIFFALFIFVLSIYRNHRKDCHKIKFIFFLSLVAFSFPGLGCQGRQQQDSQSLAQELGQGNIPLEELQPVIEEAAPAKTAQSAATATISLEVTAPENKIVRDSLQMQLALKNSGFYFGEIDGKIGPQTKRAIIEFQRAKGLEADGKVGSKTWVELEKYLTQ